MTFVSLPRTVWGAKGAEQRALLVHGLGSLGESCWQIAMALASRKWSATAVDLRGHGSAPDGPSYRIRDFAEDLVRTEPPQGSQWDVVIGHSIGAASALFAAAMKSDWTRKLILLDPALKLGATSRREVLENQRNGHLHQKLEDLTALHPSWHPRDVELKLLGQKSARLFALEHAVLDNKPWDETDTAKKIKIPTHVIGADPLRGSMFCNDYAKRVVGQNANISYEIISGAGHSIHRDKPKETIAAIFRSLSKP